MNKNKNNTILNLNHCGVGRSLFIFHNQTQDHPHLELMNLSEI